MPGTHLPQSVTFLYGGVRLGTELLALLGEEFHIDVISSPVELAKRPPTDVVVVDVPAENRRVACEAVRRHHRGPLIVLLSQGDSRHDLPPDQNRTLLRHPLSIRRLSVALAETAPTRPVLDPARHLQVLPLHGAPAGGTDSSRGAGRSPARRREHRLVRVAAISVAAALLFAGAFAVVNHGGRCGPGCDALAGTDLAAPSSTTVPLPAVQAGPVTNDGRIDPTTTSDPGVSPTADGESQVDAAGAGTTAIAGPSPSSGGSPSPSSTPDPTRPQPTAAPTTASTTTRPKPSTSTTTTTAPTTTTSPGP